MSQKKAEGLKALQAASLERDNPPPVLKPLPRPSAPPQASPTIKKSIALQSADLEKLDQLEGILRDQGYRPSFSRLIQIAIKTATTDPDALVKAMNDCKAGDGRGKW